MPNGGARPGAGRRKGSLSPYPVTRELIRRVRAALEAVANRDLEAALAEVAQDRNAPVDVRVAALRRLCGYMAASFFRQLEAEGVRLPCSRPCPAAEVTASVGAAE